MTRLPVDFAERKKAFAAQETVRARLEELFTADRVSVAVQLEALEPVDGWWRPHGKRRVAGHHRAMRWKPVADALSVGCTSAQIIRASGATPAQLNVARKAIQKRRILKVDDDKIRDWPALLADAAPRGISVSTLALEQGVHPNAVHEQLRRHGFRVLGGGKRWRIVSVERSLEKANG